MKEIGELFINQGLQLGGCVTIGDQFLWIACIENENGKDIHFIGHSVEEINKNNGKPLRKIGSLKYNKMGNELDPYLHGTIEFNKKINIGVFVSLSYYINTDDMEEIIFQVLKL